MSLPWSARIYLGMIVLVAGGLLGWLWVWQGPVPAQAGLLSLLLVLAVIAQHFPLRLGPHHQANVAIAIYFAALLLFGPAPAMTLTGASQVIGGLSLLARRNRRSGQRMRGLRGVLFNTAQQMLAIGLGGLVYAAFLPRQAPVPLDHWKMLWVLPVMASVIYLANSGAVAIMVGLQRGQQPIAVWRAERGLYTIEAVGILLLGLAIALLGSHYPWGPLVLAVPTTLLYLSLQRTMRLTKERRVVEQQMTHQAFHDPLTGLPNRAMFHDEVAQALARARQDKGRLAILFVDIDRFKLVNDSYGHTLGDQLLIAVAQRLQACLPSGTVVARFGGDEFTILAEGLSGVTDAVAVADRVAAGLRVPFTVSDRELSATASIGIAMGTLSATPEDLLRQAGTALYRAKVTGEARHVVFDPAMSATAARRLALEVDLRNALERGEFVLHYQPKVASATGRIVGLEALARWRHPRRGPIDPAEFIPLAEETGLIALLGEWVLQEACRRAAAWRREYPDTQPLLMSVNLSLSQFQHSELPAVVERALATSGLAPESLILELTESVAMADIKTVLATLHQLKGLGVLLAIDDFGSGYSSLRYLQQLPVDMLKIDRSFAADMESDDRIRGIMEALITLAHTLRLQVVAEGVETSAQAALLSRLGCDLLQGYYFAPPLPTDAVEHLLAHGYSPAGAVLGVGC